MGRQETGKTSKWVWTSGEEKALLKSIPGTRWETFPSQRLWFYPFLPGIKWPSLFLFLWDLSVSGLCVYIFHHLPFFLEMSETFLWGLNPFGFHGAAWCSKKLVFWSQVCICILLQLFTTLWSVDLDKPLNCPEIQCPSVCNIQYSVFKIQMGILLAEWLVH